jgi:hypothetical protein
MAGVRASTGWALVAAALFAPGCAALADRRTDVLDGQGCLTQSTVQHPSVLDDLHQGADIYSTVQTGRFLGQLIRVLR